MRQEIIIAEGIRQDYTFCNITGVILSREAGSRNTLTIPNRE